MAFKKILITNDKQEAKRISIGLVSLGSIDKKHLSQRSWSKGQGSKVMG